MEYCKRWLDHYHLAQGGELVAYLRSAFVSSPPITIIGIFTNHHRYQLAMSEPYLLPLQRLQRAAGARKHRVEASICPSINGCQEDKDKQLTRLKKAKYFLIPKESTKVIKKEKADICQYLIEALPIWSNFSSTEA